MYRITAGLLKMLSYMPFWLMYLVADALFIPLYYIVRYRRKVVRRNLRESFPDKDLREIKRIERGFYRSLIDVALETVKLHSVSPEVIEKRARFVNPELPNSYLAEGKSVATFIGHYGNWEWISSFGLWLYPGAVCAQIYHALHNPVMEKYILGLRERFGNVSVEMTRTARYIAQASTEGRPLLVGFISDQSPKLREAKYFIDFLNHRTPVLTGTEKLARHFGFEMLFLAARRVRRGYYEFEFMPLKPESESEFAYTDLYFKLLQKEIERAPEFYLWSHKRFRHAKGLVKEIVNQS